MDKIKHFVVLMLENHSFDQMLGYAGIPGVEGLTAGMTFKQVKIDQSTVLLPVTQDANFSMAHDPGHEFMDVRNQLWGPFGPDPDGNVGFVYAYSKSVGISFDDAKRVMAGFTPDRLPVLNALAKEYAVCDHWFSSIPGPTWPNRFFVHAATSGGLIASPNPTSIADDLKKNYDWASIEGFDFRGGTIYDTLNRAGKNWRIYHGDHLPQSAVLRGMIPRLLAHDGFKEFEDFAADAAAGDLPEYSFIEPNYGNTTDFTGGNSQHPVGDIRDGERLIKDVYTAVRNSPLWESTVLVILYDEHGGFYDHVVPPAAVPTGDDEKFNGDPVRFGFDQYGIRVPVVIVSPFIPRGTLDHTIYDHTSLLRTVENRFGLDNLTERDKVAKTFEGLLSLDAPREDALTELPDPPAGPVAVAPAGVGATAQPAPSGSFAHLAMLVDMHLNPAAKDAIKDRVNGIATPTGASQYISEIKQKVRAARGE